MCIRQLHQTIIMKIHLAAFLAAIILGIGLASPVHAQRPDPQNPVPENLVVPAGWEVRLDKPDDSVVIGSNADSADIYFVNMKPGWHITTGPRAIFWHPESTAEGTYSASTKIHLFDPKGRNEAFGLFLGGQNLNEENQTYTYFLLRNSGEYLIKKRTGNETELVKDWTKTPAMVIYDDTTTSSVPNTLSIEVGETEVMFFVNGEQVDAMPKNQLDTEGFVGLRINHALNVHVEDFGVEGM